VCFKYDITVYFDQNTVHILLLKMLGLYLYTVIIVPKSCNRFSLLNKSTLQKELLNVVSNNVVFFKQKVKTQQQQNKKSNIKTVDGVENRTRDVLQQKRMRYHYPRESTESIDCSQAI